MKWKNNSRWLTQLIAESEERPPCKLTETQPIKIHTSETADD